MDLIQLKFASLRYYSELKFKDKVLESKECFEGKYGKSQPVLVIKTLPSPEEFHLVFSTTTTIRHYSLSNTQFSTQPISLNSLAKNICFGPEENFLSYCITEELVELRTELFQVGSFVHSGKALALIHCTKPLKLVLIEGEYHTVSSEVLINILNNIKRFLVKEVKIEDFYKDGLLKTHRLPLLISKMNTVLKTVKERLTLSFKKLRNHMETTLSKKEKLFMNEYYQGPERAVKYLLTVVNAGLIFSEFSIYFAFKSLGEYQNFVIGKEKTLEKANESCKNISSRLSSGEFQDEFRSKLEIFKNYSRSELASFNFHVGDCVLRPKYAGRIYKLYYHHGVYIGCKKPCLKPKLCRTCSNIFHVTGGEEISEHCLFWLKGLPKGKYVNTSISEFLAEENFLRIKRNPYTRLSKEEYHEKAGDVIEKFNAGFNGKIQLDKDLLYNLGSNNCGHVANRFENREPDMGPCNRELILKHSSVLGAIAVVVGILIKATVSKDMDSSSTELPFNVREVKKN